MSKQKKKKKVVVTTKPKVAPTVSRKAKSTSGTTPLLFGRENFKWMLIGVAVITLGMILMMGGGMPDPNTWDDSLIYSHRRITLAPIVILIGIGIEVYAIFK